MNFLIDNKPFTTLILVLLAINLVSCSSDRNENQPTKSSAALTLESIPEAQFNEAFCEDFADFESNFCNGGLVAVNVHNQIEPFQAPGGGNGPAVRSDEYLALELVSESESILVGINMYSDTAVITRFTLDGEMGYILENAVHDFEGSPFHSLLYEMVDARTVAQAQSIADTYLESPSETVNDEDDQSTARVAIYSVDATLIDEPDGPEGLISGCYRGERRTINRIVDYILESAGVEASLAFEQDMYFAIRNQMRYRCGDEFRDNDCLGCVPNIGCALTGAFVFLADKLNGDELAQIVDKLLVDIFNFSPGIAAASLLQDPDPYAASLAELFFISGVSDSEDCLLIEEMFNGVVRDLLLDGATPYQNSSNCPTGVPVALGTIVSNNNLSLFSPGVSGCWNVPQSRYLRINCLGWVFSRPFQPLPNNTYAFSMNRTVIEYDSRTIGGNCQITFPSMVAAAINTAYAQNATQIASSPLVGLPLDLFASQNLRLAFNTEFSRQISFCSTSGGNGPSYYWGINATANTCVNLPAASNLNFSVANFQKFNISPHEFVFT